MEIIKKDIILFGCETTGEGVQGERVYQIHQLDEALRTFN